MRHYLNCICGLFAIFALRLTDEAVDQRRAKAKENTNKLTDLVAAGASRQIRLNQKADNYTKRKQTTWFAFFLLLLHTMKNVGKRPSARRIWQRNVGRWQTRHAVLTNMARCVGKFPAPRLPKSNAEKCAKTHKMKRFCKVQVSILNSYFLIFLL